jgi:hypothetical protein
MKTVTGNDLLRACSKAVATLQTDEAMTAASTSAGFIIPNGQKRGQRLGVQVFVKVCRYSEELLKRRPCTGGLLCEKQANSKITL